MTHRVRLLIVTLALAIVGVQCETAHAASLGVLRGVVRDQYGLPLVGASVAIFDAASKASKPIRDTLTNETGQFAAHIAPGRYVLRAVAAGFNTFEGRARVAAGQETVLDSIALRRANTMADRSRMESRDPYRQVVRTARGHVFHLDKTDADDDEQRERANAQALALTDKDSATHGVVQTLGASGASDYVATNFAFARSVRNANLVVAGQVGAGEDAPMRLEATTEAPIGEDHDVGVTVGFGRRSAMLDASADRTAIDQFTVQAEDHWRIAGPVVLVYGFNFSRFTGDTNTSSILPRLGVEYAPSNRTEVFARLTPGSSSDQIATFQTESGDVAFRSENPIARSLDDGGLLPDRSRRYEVGFSHLIDERSNVEVMAFYDIASGRGVGFLSAPSPEAAAEFQTGSLNGRSSGFRVLYTRRLTRNLTGTFGYSAGRGLELSSEALVDPSRTFDQSGFQMFAGEVEADFSTGTRLAVSYRFSPNTVVFAIDPFEGRLTAYQPSASVSVIQPLRMPGFMPGRWEAMLDIRNLFDCVPTAEDGDVSLVEYSRLVRAGVSFRF